VYIADTGDSAIKEYSASAQTLSTLVSSGLSGPAGVAVDSLGNVYWSDTGNGKVEEQPRAFVDPTARVEAASATSDALPGVLPAAINLQAPFAPSSSQAWLGIGSIAGGVVNLSFSANSGLDRTAQVTLLGQAIPIEQQGVALAPGLGTLNSGSGNLTPGGSYVWDIDDATGTAGGQPGWSLISVNGTLDVQATAAAGDKFTIQMVSYSDSSTPGPTPGFYYTNKGAGYYSWKIATATAGILDFDPTKFHIDTSQFANYLGGGTFSVSLAGGDELDLTYEPYACAASDMATPGYELTNYPSVNPTFVGVYLFYTNAHGLGGIQGTLANNCSMPHAWAYGPGLPATGVDIGAVAVDLVNYTLLPIGTTNVTILAVKADTTTYAVVNARAWDSCFATGANFDPEVAIVTAGRSVQAQQVYAGLDSAEHYITILNGNPGLTALRLLVNGWTYNLGAVGQGQTVMVDVGASFKPGSTNTVALLGEGPSGATADVVISDQPAGSLLAVSPTIQPPVLSIVEQQGNVVVQWLAPASFFTLQGRQSLSPETPWLDLSSSQQESQGWSSVTLPVNTGPQFFRLRK
jgi:hypothetical protein